MKTAAPALDIARLRIVPLPSEKALADFRCGEDAIDKQLPTCCEWQRTHRSRVYCAYLTDDPTPYGFYCLGLHAHDSKHVAGFFQRSSDDVRNFVPFIYINYLAVREGWRRRKIGTVLLMHALETCSIRAPAPARTSSPS